MLQQAYGALISSATQKALLQTGGNMAASEYVYTMGLGPGQFSYTSAINVFVNAINFILVVSPNTLFNRMKEKTLF